MLFSRSIFTLRIRIPCKRKNASILRKELKHIIICRRPESNRYGYHYPRDFKSRASASSATAAFLKMLSHLERPRRDSNSRPPPWQGGALTNWATGPYEGCTFKIAYKKLFNILPIHLTWLCPRPISNSQLHVLPHFHLCPIYLVVFKGSYNFRWDISSWGGLHA